MTHRRYLGKWELGCIVFNALLVKIFTGYPRRFAEICGSGGALCAMVTGAIFLILFYCALTLYEKRDKLPWVRLWKNHAVRLVVFALAAAYFLFSLVYGLRAFTAVLQLISYPAAPAWFLMIFFGLGAAAVMFCGVKAVFRMHSLCVLYVGVVVAVIALTGVKYAEPAHLTPLWGNGPASVFGRGMETLFLYSDAVAVFFLASRQRPEVKTRRCAMAGAAAAVILNVAVVLVASMNQPYEVTQTIAVPIYPLTKVVYFGKFWSRLDALYLIAFLISAMLYLSLELFLLLESLKRLRVRPKSLAAGALCLGLCFSLCSCYDNREVEESAYLIALGVDKGKNAPYCYTFQFSNPLETGDNLDSTSMAGQDKSDEGQDKAEEGGSEEGNKTVNNLVVEESDYYMAFNKVRSLLSKEPDMSHLKLIAFSQDTAREGILEHASLLMREREIRPSTNLCLTQSAQEFLTSIKPTLEQSTGRYYELMFQNKRMPYAPVVELREFVSRGTDSSREAVLPIADKDKLMGMGIFKGGVLQGEMSDREVQTYKLLTGELRRAAIQAGEDTVLITSSGKPKISAEISDSSAWAQISLTVTASPVSDCPSPSVMETLKSELERQTDDFLQKTVEADSDVLGIGQKIKGTCSTTKEWERYAWPNPYKKVKFSVKISVKSSNFAEMLQKKK